MFNSVVQPQFEATIPLVGRDAEWALLQRAWREAAGQPRLMLISGEAGIGKTRLAEALAEWVGRQGIPVLAARCYATEGELAYAPIVTWLRSQPRPCWPPPGYANWRACCPRSWPSTLIYRPLSPLPQNWQRLRLFEAVTRALFTGRAATLLFLDDLQWCDRRHAGLARRSAASRWGAGFRRPRPGIDCRDRQAGGRRGQLGARSLESRAAAAPANSPEIELGPLSQEATRVRWPTASPAGRSTGRSDRRCSKAAREIRCLSSKWCAAGFEPTVPAPADHAAAMMGNRSGLACQGASSNRSAPGPAFPHGAERDRAGGGDRTGLHLRRPGPCDPSERGRPRRASRPVLAQADPPRAG